MAWSVCLYAADARALPQAVAALDDAAAGGRYDAHLVVPGRDEEAAYAARALAAADPRLNAHELPVADRATAWNDYVHRIAPAADTHIFLDAGAQPARAAFKALALALEASPKAYAATGLPAGRLEIARRHYTERALAGELYALRGATLARLRAQRLFLPAGAASGEDILCYLLHTDLVGGDYDGWRERVCVAAGAYFEPAHAAGLDGLARWRRALERAARGRLQNELLLARLKRSGVAAMPADISELYIAEDVSRLRPRMAPPHLLFDTLALVELRGARRQT